MTISIKPTASGSTIEQDGSTILTVDGSGNISTAYNLSVSGTVSSTGNVSVEKDTLLSFFPANQSYANIKFEWDTGDAGYLHSTAFNGMKWTTNGSERMRITPNGRVNFTVTGNGATSSNQGVSIGGGSNSESFIEIVRGSGTSEYTHMYFGNGNGTVGTIKTSGTSTSYNTSSDYRLKENAEPMTGSIDRLKELKPSRFNFINDPDTAVDGFLAHEAQIVVPESVTGTHNEVDDNGQPIYQGIDQSKLVPLLTAALQEAVTKIEDLETRIQALESN